MRDKEQTDALIALIKARITVEDIAGRFVRLTNVGVGKKKGKCPFHAEKTPSFTIDTVKGLYHCFGCNAGGDLFSFVMAIHACDFLDAIDWIAHEFNLPVPTEQNDYAPMLALPPAIIKKQAEAESQAAKKERDTKMRIKVILDECADPIWWPVGNCYLLSRGLSAMPPTLRSLRVHPSLWHRDTDRYYPVLLGIIQRNANDRGCQGLQRIYLQPDGSSKAKDVKPEDQKRALGHVKGGAVWLWDQYNFGFWPYWKGPGDSIVGDCWICEGIETGIALYQFLQSKDLQTPWIVACAVNAQNMQHVQIPPCCNRVIFAADKDRSQTGQEQARIAGAKYQNQGYQVSIKLPPLPISDNKKGIDWLDAIAKIKGGSRVDTLLF